MNKSIYRSLLIILAIIISILFVFPMFWMVMTSFKTDTEALVSGLTILPKKFTLENYIYSFKISGLGVSVGRWVLNSLFVSTFGTVLIVILDSLAAYGLARLDIPGKKWITSIIFGTLMIPGIIAFLPLYLEFNYLGFLDSYKALILPYTANAFGVFLIYQFLKDFPKELEEAAYIEGANKFQVFFKVILPNIKPILWTLGIFSFTGIYNDFLWPLVSISSPQLRTITSGLAIVQQGLVIKFGKLMAISTIATIPSLIIFFIGQKHFVKGMVNSGMK
ncbi:carbohydrate ABC transporter permease [Cetobacterium somerae]|uniref:carbohydrate ABC transporter permease n=1 Tax=Cetobacterium sp. NK01 TaxID=2993530 RepID=UPI0021166E7D|nr:carbohydrate ABC transporter permease [Cetobacterium sp. NK01]MCQ8211035.1 carbohydrate ABC transporter permease [Cetobacterium sp. NK01]